MSRCLAAGVAKLDADRRVEAVGKLDNLFPLVALFIIPDSGAIRGDPAFGGYSGSFDNDEAKTAGRTGAVMN